MFSQRFLHISIFSKTEIFVSSSFVGRIWLLSLQYGISRNVKNVEFFCVGPLFNPSGAKNRHWQKQPRETNLNNTGRWHRLLYADTHSVITCYTHGITHILNDANKYTHFPHILCIIATVGPHILT